MKLWEKNIDTNKLVEIFTVGKDRELDIELAQYDVVGTLAHIEMLKEIKLLSGEEFGKLRSELLEILKQIESNNFSLSAEAEDIHSHIEWLLTDKLGDTGKKIHAGRSRNDQVLLDLRLKFRDDIKELVNLQDHLFSLLITLADKNRDILMPGYTHLQAAMPSSFGLWFSAYAENIIDDLRIYRAALEMINQNPLGSGAGYGSSLPLDRKLTTSLLGFQDLAYNSVHAQMGRGRSELFLSFALSATANTLAKLAMDVCLYSSQNFGFIALEDAFTTGSSIMPHKKNPDVFELIRGKCLVIAQLPGTISGAFGYLPSGYHRDYQLLKEQIFPAVTQIKNCISIAIEALQNISISAGILDDPMYLPIFSVERVNQLVSQGVPFREAYKRISGEIDKNENDIPVEINHTHIGSIGNLSLDNIEKKYHQVRMGFDFSKSEQAIAKLTGN